MNGVGSSVILSASVSLRGELGLCRESPLSLTFSGLAVWEPLAHAVGVCRVITRVF